MRGNCIAFRLITPSAVTTIIVVSDNGIPEGTGLTAADGASQECDDSPGKKGTPFPCGRNSIFLAKGPGIVAGKVMGFGQLNMAVDVAPTLLQLAGGKESNGYGISFADCLTESNGQSAASCRHTRDTSVWWEWRPTGGKDGTNPNLPNPGVDDADEWTEIEVAVETYKNGEFMLLHRVWDVDLFDGTAADAGRFEESLWPIDQTTQGRYIDEGEPRLTTEVDRLLVDGDFLVGPNANESLNLIHVHKAVTDIQQRGGNAIRTIGAGR